MAKQSLKEIIKLEYQKCAQDPIYFMKKYCMIQHPVRGKIPFHLYQFQERTLDQFAEHRYNIILKSRQTGISTLTAGFSLWKMLFNQDFNVLVIATKQEVAKNLVTKVRVMNQYLPSWLKQTTVEDNKLSLRYSNGSQIKATSAAGDAGRSEALSLLVFDEAAFIDKIEDIWISAQSTLSTGGNAIILSTPNGVGNFFHKTWVGAEEEENGFNPIRLHWSVHPERNQDWRDEQEVLLGVKGAAQECDCDFVSSGDTVIDPQLLMFYKESYVQEPVEKTGFDGNLWKWEYPNYQKSYMVVADVARGDSTDYSAFHVFDIENAVQVAEYKGKLSPKEFGNFLVGIASEYNEALLVCENANIGWATIEQILEREYRNMYYSTTNNMESVESYMHKYERDKLVPGFTMSARTRPLVIAKMIEYIRDHSVTIQSKRLMGEMRVFVWKNGKAQAQDRYNDDLIMSCATALYVRDTALRLRQQGMDLARAQLSSFSNLNAQNKAVMTNVASQRENPYLTKTAYGDEDIRWLLK